MVSSKVLPIGIEGHGLPFCGQNARLGLPLPRLPSVQQMNKFPACIFEENVVLSARNNRYSVFFWSTLCSVPIVSNNKEYNHENKFSVAFSQCVHMVWAMCCMCESVCTWCGLCAISVRVCAHGLGYVLYQ